MKFNTEGAPASLSDELAVGNVYRSKGPGPKFWVIIAIRDGGVTCIGIDALGNIVSGTNYARHVFEGCYGTAVCWRGREIVGRCKDLDLSFNIVWEALP